MGVDTTRATSNLNRTLFTSARVQQSAFGKRYLYPGPGPAGACIVFEVVGVCVVLANALVDAHLLCRQVSYRYSPAAV